MTSRIVWTLLIEVLVFVVTIILAMVDSSEWPGVFFYLTIGCVILLNSKWYFVPKIVLTYCEKKCSSDREKLLKFGSSPTLQNSNTCSCSPPHDISIKKCVLPRNGRNIEISIMQNRIDIRIYGNKKAKAQLLSLL